jgi:hypothetical protein
MGNDHKGKKSASQQSRCLTIARKGIRTSHDFANMMSALMTDLAEGSMTPGQGNAICNAGGKLLKNVELEQKYGVKGPGNERTLQLADGTQRSVSLQVATAK